MTRITNTVRQRMADDLLKRRFVAEGEVLCRRSAELFDRVYKDRYDADARNLMAKLKRKFRNAFVHNSRIQCRAGGGFRVDVGAVTIGADNVKFRVEVEPLPFLHGCNNGDAFRFVDCEISQALEQFATDTSAFTVAVKNARRELLGALATVNTDKQLAELWPEALPILAPHIPVPNGSNLPAVQFSRLTDAFGLRELAGAE